ncbi:MAG: 4'-phosphopantetheinyl transferase superfamily protein [Thermodesulfobacteriota bacterium]
MEDVSKVNGSVLFPVDLPVQPYLLDHRFEGRVVLPAVEAMQALAAAVKRFRADVDVSVITRARFDKFLYIDPGATHISASIAVAESRNGGITASLLTKSQSTKLAIKRVREHATLCFPPPEPDRIEPPLDLICALEGICFEIPSERLYRDLVPFGVSYQNVRDPLLITRDGAIAWTCAPQCLAGEDEAAPLGSPFPLDASFHAACAWGQRYAGIVAFPVEIEKRVMLRRTLPGSTYLSRILPVRTGPDLLTFDIWIYDEGGALYEGALGVSMRDVSAGRLKPPQWVIDPDPGLSLERIRSRCRGLSVVELRTVLPFAYRALSVSETERFQRLGPARRRSYLAARLACKRLARTLRGNDALTPASELTTLGPDQIRPCCPLDPEDSPVSCSVSHDDRFGVAAAGEHRVGVDVERISERALRSRHLYMKESEPLLVREAALGEMETAVRVWTLKEAAAKAFDLTLAESWNRVRVIAVGTFESRFQLDREEPLTAAHDQSDGHLFTLVCEKGGPAVGRA